MKNADDAIERVLMGLRDAEAPAGMERRILAAIEDRALDTARAGARAGWHLPLWLVGVARPSALRYAVMGCAAAGVIALVLTIPGRSRREQAPLKAKMGSVANGQSGPVVEESVIGSQQPASTARLARTARVANAPEGPVAGGNEADDLDAVAMSETRAASFPAPPMPLTEQERLLVRMLHRGDGVELAMLDSKMEALRDAEEKAEFQRFFARPVVKDAMPDGSGGGQSGAGAAQSNAEPAAVPAAEGVSPAVGVTEQTAPEKTGPLVANPVQPNAKDGLPQ
jgi:hypothetical protein